MKLSDVHIALMEHCIGLDNHKPYRRHGKLFFKPKRNYFDCGPANLEAWEEIVALGLAIDWDGKGWFKLTKAGFEALSSVTGIHIHDEEAAFVPALPKRLYVIGPDIIDSTGDEAVFEEAAEKSDPKQCLCGGNPEVVIDGDLRVYVHCPDCGAKGPSASISSLEDDTTTFGAASLLARLRETAKAAWSEQMAIDDKRLKIYLSCDLEHQEEGMCDECFYSTHPKGLHCSRQEKGF